MDYTAEEKAIVYLTALTGFDKNERNALLSVAKSAEECFNRLEKIVPAVIKPEKKGLYNSDCVSRERETDAFLKELGRKGYFVVTVASPDYPGRLKAIPDAPPVLYGKGNRALLQKKMFCIVGSRVTPPWAIEQAKKISERLSEHFVIVTGLAEGGDLAAIIGAQASGNLISVLPNGLDECYPAAHASLKERIAENGLLLTEYPPKEKTKTYSFQYRNRILAGLAEGVLVVSAGEKSGTKITAKHAVEFGRDLFAFPYNIGVKQGEGCNTLLKNGATLVTEAKDVLSFYGFAETEREKTVLSESEELCYKIIKDLGEAHLAVIARRAGMQIFEAASVLSSLEIKNLVVKAGGNRYAAL